MPNGARLPPAISQAIRVDEVDPPTRAILERAKANAAVRQWDEAVETLRQVMEQQGGKLIRLDENRFVPVREYCQMRLAELPALRARSIADESIHWQSVGIKRESPIAIPNRSAVWSINCFSAPGPTRRCLALGDIALEQGDFSEARWCWERISPELRTSDGKPLWLDWRTAGENPPANDSPASRSPVKWLAYPDSQMNLADVRAAGFGFDS